MPPPPRLPLWMPRCGSSWSSCLSAGCVPRCLIRSKRPLPDLVERPVPRLRRRVRSFAHRTARPLSLSKGRSSPSSCRCPARARCYGEPVKRTVAAVIVAVLALAVSAGYFYVLNDGYAKPTDIAGTLYRFAGSTLTVFLVGTSVLLTFPSIIGTRLRRFATAAGVLGWVSIEIGAMAFSLFYDYLHLDKDTRPWDDVKSIAFLAGIVLLIAAVTLFLIRPRVWGRGWVSVAWIALFSLIGLVAVVVLLIAALVLRYFLFVIPIAAIVVAVVARPLRRRASERMTTAAARTPTLPDA
jgi:hypothetical protein